MSEIQERIKSLRESVGVEYVRPDPARIVAYIQDLGVAEHAMKYLYGRGLTDDTIAHFKLGFDKSKNAISIPIFKGDLLVNIKYRYLSNQDTRYTSESGAENWLFNDGGLLEAEPKGALLIVEGEFDCMAVWQTGIKNVVSPSLGKDSFTAWLQPVDKIKRIYLAYDNDEGGKSTSKKIAERLGIERCLRVDYQDCKDANEFLQKHSVEEFRGLLKNAKIYTNEKYQNLGDVIANLRNGVGDAITTAFVPGVRFARGWMGIISGRTNVGKTSYVLNIANELAEKGVGVLIIPFERGIESVGERFLQVRSKSSPQDFKLFTKDDWDKLATDVADLPLCFAMPKKDETVECILQAKKFFGTQVVIIDHLDYMVRQIGSGNKGDAIADTLQQLKHIAEQNGVVLLIVSHVRKTERPGEFIGRAKKPNIEDLKGSSSLYQDPEVVVMLSQTENEYEMSVDVLKNKGEMKQETFVFDVGSGVYTPMGI